MKAFSMLKKLCMPAYVYFVISIILFVYAIVLNISETTQYKIGNMVFPGVNTALIFVLKLVFIVIITWVLNFVCSTGYPGIAWLLVFLPYIIAVGLGVYLGLQDAKNNTKNNVKNNAKPVSVPVKNA